MTSADRSTRGHNRGLHGFNYGQLFKEWLRVMWFDILVLAALGGTALGIYSTPVVSVRTFPVTFDGSGDIVFPNLAYPNRGWIIESWTSALISILIPAVVVLVAQYWVRNFWDLNNAIFGLMQSLAFANLFQVVTKQLIGGFRPYFLQVCMPDISLAESNNATGLNGVGYRQIMYTIDICTQPDKSLLKNAITSFPSGHTTTGCAAFVFLFLYINGKLKVWTSTRPASWKLALTVAPLLGAWLKGCVLTVDQAHHWYDILAGACIGTGAAFASYRACYAAVFDARFSHIPLSRTTPFVYSTTTDATVPAAPLKEETLPFAQPRPSSVAEPSQRQSMAESRERSGDEKCQGSHEMSSDSRV